MQQVQLSPVTFHGDTLHIIEQNGEPFTPMKPIVENMGLAWQTQQRKLSDNKDRWGITIMVTPSASGDQQTLCMPVRKLPAFFASINPKKVREELRERICLYQDECDNALWDYWTKGQATSKVKKALPEAKKPAQKALPKAEQKALPAVIDPIAAHAMKAQAAMDEVKTLCSEFIASVFRLQSAIRRPVRTDSCVSKLTMSLERNLPVFGTAIGMNVSALSELLEVYAATLRKAPNNSRS